MPLQYDPQGLVTSHQHTRTACSLFDVSHMAQVRVTGRDRVAFLEQLVVGDIQALKPGQMTLSLLTNENGGIIDDTVITNQPHWFNDQAANCGSDVAVSPSEPALYMVLNAACADKDLAHLRNAVQASGLDVTVSAVTDCALLALQGPKAAAVLERLAGQSFAHLAFMHAEMATLGGAQCHIARCGYTGEDGFEISVPAGQATHLAEQLLADPAVELAGLAVRDSLRLEAGLCLYGHDLNETTTPVEAGLTWTIGKRRRQPGADTFPGAAVILPQIKIKGTSAGYNPPSRRRVGLVVEKSPAREHAIIYNQDQQPVGAVTSGMPSPTTRGLNIAMGYVQDGYHKTGTELLVGVRKRLNPAKVVKMPFVPAQYYKGA
ncbi:hypothetical protein H4R35_006523 [Dimargaris xerosporica]|nr:hypothetical protein H4R35_006523 [Dimargaris xerosporica]